MCNVPFQSSTGMSNYYLVRKSSSTTHKLMIKVNNSKFAFGHCKTKICTPYTFKFLSLILANNNIQSSLERGEIDDEVR